MKKLFLIAAAIFATTFSVSAQDTEVKKERTKVKKERTERDYGNDNWDNWGGGTKVRGEGPSVSETRDAKGFKGVKSAISGDITLKQSSNGYKVVVEGQKNILAHLITEVVDGNVKIYYEKGFSIQNKVPIKISLEAPAFDYIGLSGSGDVRTNGALSGDKMTVKLSGSGNFNLDELKYTDLAINLSGSGNVKLSGTAATVDLSISGSGNLNADNLQAQKANCSISGSGNLSLNVSKEMDARISGSGDIRYSGNPASVKSKVSGSGEIKSK